VPDIQHYVAVCAAAELRPVPLVPEISTYAAEDAYEVWEITRFDKDDAAVPSWSYPWAGGQALARWLLDRPGLARGRVVLDLAAGSGLVAIAAAKAGAARAIANDIDEFAAAAQDLNARANGVRIETLLADILDTDADSDADSETGAEAGVEADVVLAGDVCYEPDLSRRLLAFLRRAAGRGATVLLGDPGRTYLPKDGLEPVATYDVPTSFALEGTEHKRTTIWRPLP
jgi:predicted nicotinamide N-methyase